MNCGATEMQPQQGEIIGYEIDGKLYHPADVMIIRASAPQKVEIIPLRPKMILGRRGWPPWPWRQE